MNFMKGDPLRKFLDEVADMGELRIVSGADPATEIGPISRMASVLKPVPLIHFKNIRGAESFSIGTFLFGSDKRARAGFKLPPDISGKELAAVWKKRLDTYRPIPPVQTRNSPVFENKFDAASVDVMKIPQTLWHEGDGRPYFGNHACVITKDPETNLTNLGVYRCCSYDKNTIGMHLAIGHHGQINRDKWWESGKDCPVVIVCGVEPVMMAAAETDLSYTEDNYAWAGWLKDEPVEVIEEPVTGFLIPATAEVVLAGEILRPEVEPPRVEGPWAEGQGYYAKGLLSPVIEIRSMMHRDKPIILGTCAGVVPPMYSYPAPPIRGEVQAGTQWHKLGLMGAEDVKCVGSVGPFKVVSIHQRYPGHSRRVAELMMAGIGFSRPPKYLIVVDEDIDPWNPRAVWWALTTRTNPADQIHLLKDVYPWVTDPRLWTKEAESYPLEVGFMSSSMVIDACVPFRMKKDFAKLIGGVSPQLRKKVFDRLEGQLDWLQGQTKVAM
jgi:4-hydroxy-3-polyprenylbenzoate decarboxylase